MLSRRSRLLVGVAVCMALAAPATVLLLRDGAGSGEAPAPVAGVEVPTAPGAWVHVAIAGDTGTGDAAAEATSRQMTEEARRSGRYDALLLLGDLVYDDGDLERVDDAVTGPFADLLSEGATLVPVLGNHDYASGEQSQIMNALGHDTTWYVTDIGLLRIIVLDTERTDDPRQTAWLHDALATARPPETWTIAAMHKPAYSAGSHGSDLDVRSRWVPLFEQYDVPLVLAGHDHDYQRSRTINGVTYVVSGAGARLRPTGSADFTAVSTSTLHFIDMLVSDDSLMLRAIDQGGALVDRFTITR
jgi:predicted MPP superfamily phosphohydrolase